ncbi:uncharacterized protein CcaverHIS019_0202340 [Cutaneotrichosporon cavernicola]|uniref:tRNA-5-taurinomethyluridine 2-sulfurtransferase n=1 Tax=Cutaneotrichosporon cavernicola TaxID=279322 RepID=A0AA48I3V6_9TREE|nr:uncharacterized protein CcaverHIS019_0202340 [Cutaneotrichosporon cavernicola]BEI88872.1 hypothetical protein CcaverHIS019_0202340 [Cutaneotrichosporon cavernicola]
MWTAIGALRAPAPRRSCYDDLCLSEGDNVVVAVSGGVDSSVTLRLLSELPLNLSVLFMRNWDPVLSENAPASSLSLAYNNPAVHSPCTWERDWADARAVARHIGIPDNKVRLVDLTAEYWTRVFEPSIAEWEQARTPNPDVWCNREIKFGALLKHIPEGHFLATGHYARVRRQGGRATLHRAHDMNKDQTFYLSQVTEAALQRAVFPLAGLPKPAVRELAREWHLPTAERRESMGLCFIGKRRNFGDFVSQYVPPTTGWFVNEAGQRVGEHKGLSQYTVGQRARIILLKPGLKSDMWGKLFVARKGVNGGNDILVVPRTDHPALLCSELWSDEFNWIAGEPPLLEDGHELMAQVRHREAPFRAHMRVDGSRIYVTFPDPVRAVPLGQVAALWDGDKCLGSGVIHGTHLSPPIGGSSPPSDADLSPPIGGSSPPSDAASKFSAKPSPAESSATGTRLRRESVPLTVPTPPALPGPTPLSGVRAAPSRQTEPAVKRRRTGPSRQTEPVVKRRRAVPSRQTEPAVKRRRAAPSRQTEPAVKRRRAVPSRQTEPAVKRRRAVPSRQTEPAVKRRRAAPSRQTEPAVKRRRAAPSRQTEPVVKRRRQVRVARTVHGRGIFAQRDCDRGEILYAEAPLLTAPRRVDTGELLHLAQQLEKNSLLRLLSWEGGCPNGTSSILAIFLANAIPCVEEEPDDDAARSNQPAGLFRYASQINHACSPNAGWHWSEQEKKLTVRKASNTNRRRLGAILAGWEECGIDHCLGTARAQTLAEVEEAVRLCRTERLVGDLSTIWLQKFYVHAAHAEYDMAKHAARKAVAALSRVRGRYAAQKHWLASYARDPAVWETYGICIPTQH